MDAAVLGPSRAADWRFLLPSVPGTQIGHLVLLGGTPQLADTVTRLGTARRVSLTLPAVEQADAIVILAGARVPMRRVAPHLAADGALYWEVDRRSRWALNPQRAMRQLRRHGLTPTAAYWVKPGFPDRDMYLPVGDNGAFNWYLESLYRPASPFRKALKALLKTMAAAGVAVGRLAPCYAVTATRGVARPSALVGGARLNGLDLPADAAPVLLTHGRSEGNRLVGMLFDPGTSSPRAALKMPRTPLYNVHTEAEDEALEAIEQRVSPTVRGSIPWSTLYHWNGVAVSCQTCVDGAALDTRTGLDWTLISDEADRVAEWLAAFHTDTTEERVPARTWLAPRLSDMANAYSVRFGLTDAERSLMPALPRLLADVERARLPIAWQHGDLVHWNVYRTGDRIAVIDWEGARRGPALVDLLYFVTHWSADVAGCGTNADRLRHFEALFCAPPADPLATAVHQAIAAYMRRLDLPPRLLPFLLLYTFLEQSLHATPKFKGEGDAGLHPAGLHGAFVDVIARNTDILFKAGVRRVA